MRQNNTTAILDPPETFTKSLYNSFFLLLGITVPKNLHFKETSFPLLTMIIYVSAGIILLNLLIGIMSQPASDGDHRAKGDHPGTPEIAIDVLFRRYDQHPQPLRKIHNLN